MSELFESTTKKKKGRPNVVKEKVIKKSKTEKNLEKIKDMTEDNEKPKKRVSDYRRYDFKCATCGISVTLEGDHPDFPKRTKCHHHQ